MNRRYGARKGIRIHGAPCLPRGGGASGGAFAVGADRPRDAALAGRHPAAIGAAVAPGSVGVAAPDGAGRRTSRELAPPDNVVLLKRPPWSPELDPMETACQYPKENRLANRVFADVAAVADACRKAWEWFAAAPNRIASIMRRGWAIVPAPAQTRQNG